MDIRYENLEQINISAQQINKKLHINLIKKVTTKFGETFFCLDRTNNVCFYANSLLKTYIHKLLPNLQQEDNLYYFKSKELDNILTIKITGEEKDRKTGKVQQQFDIKTFLNGNISTIKTDRVLQLTNEDLEN